MTSAPFPPPPVDQPATEQPPACRPPLRRSGTDRMLGGVSGGLAEHTGIDPVLWRVGFVCLTLAGVVVFLIWFWLINVALLFGIELDAEIERTKELKEGVPRADKEIQLDARANPKDKQTT